MEPVLLINGTVSGALYGLIGLAFFLFTRATALINFAIGAYVMFAGMTGAYFADRWSWPLPATIAISLLAGVALAALTELCVLKPTMARTREEFGPVMAVVSFMFVIEQTSGLVFGRQPLRGEELSGAAVDISGIVFSGNDVVALFGILVVFAAISLWLKKGHYGRMLRAVGDNSAAAEVLGLPVRRIRLLTVVITGLISGCAGIIASAQAGIQMSSHLSFAIFGFTAFLIGGIASSWAPLVGGLIVGIIEVASARLLGGFSRDYVLLALVVLVFTVRPHGLFAFRTRL
jgi:branched-chain amino acid transport system permease protein